MAEPVPRTVTLTRPALVAVALVTLLGLGLFSAQLVFIVQQRSLVASQRAIAKRQERRARPVLRTADALLGDPGNALSAAREAGAALEQLRAALRAVDRSGLVGVAARALRRAPELIAAVDRAVAVLDRTYPTLRESLATLRQSLDVQRATLENGRETRDIARQSLDIQRQALARLVEAVGIARATLGHAESIDRKTGGRLPPAGR